MAETEYNCIDKQSIQQAGNELDSYYFDEMFCKGIEIESEYEAITKAKVHMKNIEETIDSLDQPYRCILYLRYIRGRSIEHIAVKLNYSERQVLRRKKKAIEEYAKTMRKSYKKQ